MNKEKNKDVGLKMFNWAKKHKILSILLCLLLAVFCFKGIIWIYNDIAYGRFEKVGEIENERTSKDIRYNPVVFFEANKKLFIFSPTKKDKIPSYKIYELGKKIKSNNETLPHALNIIPLDTNNNEITFLTNNTLGEYNFGSSYNLVYKYNYNTKTLKHGDDFSINVSNEKFTIGTIHQEPNFIRLNDDKTLIWSVSSFKKASKMAITCNSYTQHCIYNFSDVQPIKITKLDHNNLLIYGYENNKTDKKNIYKYNIITNDLKTMDININTKDIFENNNLFWLDNNRFVTLQYNKFGKIKKIKFNIYQINKDKITFLKTYYYTSNNIFDYVSNNNIIPVNNNFLLFVGGGISFWNHTHFINKVHLFNFTTGKMYKLNNFPYKISGQTFFTASDGHIYIGGGETCKYLLFFKKYSNLHGVYRFKQGKKLTEKIN